MFLCIFVIYSFYTLYNYDGQKVLLKCLVCFKMLAIEILNLKQLVRLVIPNIDFRTKIWKLTFHLNIKYFFYLDLKFLWGLVPFIIGFWDLTNKQNGIFKFCKYNIQMGWIQQILNIILFIIYLQFKYAYYW